jgi:hypothetical protein
VLDAGWQSVTRKRIMKDEFWVLRPLMLFSTGFLVLGIVLHACREAAQQRARFSGDPRVSAHSAGTNSCPTVKSTAAFRAFPPASLPGGSFEVTVPGTD